MERRFKGEKNSSMTVEEKRSPVKPPTTIARWLFDNTQNDELYGSVEHVKSGWVMHECKGLWPIWSIYG
ncbi:hypothetical protein M0804_007454 [Polistes exclamans]|nr:hypothetical protein M0804_007454 [Polistes exclamans]